VKEDEVDEEEADEEEDDDEMLKSDTSASYSISDVCSLRIDVENADTELDKEVSDVDLRSVDMQSSFEPELQQLSSAEPQQVPDAKPLTSQTQLMDAQPPSRQVICIHCNLTDSQGSSELCVP